MRQAGTHSLMNKQKGKEMITTAQQIVLGKLNKGWKLQASPYYEAPVWLSKGQGGRKDPYQTIPVRHSTLNALLKMGLIKYNLTNKTYQLSRPK